MTTTSLETSTTVTDSKKPITSIDGQKLKKLLEASLLWLKANQQMVNSLNVFPVPDGDTGTNMLLTMQAAYNEVASSSETNIGKMAKDIAQGALMGARGNSGVILSQIWRGFARALDSLPEMDHEIFARALAESRNTAYKGVVRPVEGTILTVIKDISIAIEKAAARTTDLEELLKIAVNAADESVKFTPELLPILKSAGVVDSGGKGLFFILEGMQRHIQGQTLDSSAVLIQPLSSMDLSDTMDEVEEGQDVEVVIDFSTKEPLVLESFYEKLSEIGTSVQVGEGDGMYRMHIHVEADKRHEPLNYISSIGTWSKVAMENLQLQMDNSKQKSKRYQLNDFHEGNIAVVAVSPGLGISKILASLGVAAIIEGGQTMNPSTEEILKAFEDLPTNNVIILPNNKNIVLAANTAKSVSVKNVFVVESKTIPQGLSAMLRLDPEGDAQKIAADMVDALTEVDTCEITTATRSVKLNGVEVQIGKIIGLLNGKLLVSGDSVKEACTMLLKKADMSARERITLFYGENMEQSDVKDISEYLTQLYPDHEIEVHEGGQPHYQLIISLE
ncbi:MAG: dihydroxyacetone kinase [Chloroflexi bacterium HGW-Chloroflexi-5]|nr:MAG: dihydroxyacetone kinase [Chloroflexi bacterium HGW-Chloroflexi-5]